MTKTQLRHKLKLDMHPLVGGSKSLQVRIHKGDNRFYGICLSPSSVWQKDFCST